MNQFFSEYWFLILFGAVYPLTLCLCIQIRRRFNFFHKITKSLDIAACVVVMLMLLVPFVIWKPATDGGRASDGRVVVKQEYYKDSTTGKEGIMTTYRGSGIPLEAYATLLMTMWWLMCGVLTVLMFWNGGFGKDDEYERKAYLSYGEMGGLGIHAFCLVASISHSLIKQVLLDKSHIDLTGSPVFMAPILLVLLLMCITAFIVLTSYRVGLDSYSLKHDAMWSFFAFTGWYIGPSFLFSG